MIGGAGLGNALGIVVGSLLRRINPPLTGACWRWSPTSWSCWSPRSSTACSRSALLGLIAGLAQSLAKFSLDATIQRDVPERVQSSAFARSDTTLQLAWVIGGFVGHRDAADPPRLGLGVAAGGAGRLVGVRAGPTAAPAAAAYVQTGNGQSSSSSASARSSLATGLAVRASGWRPWR